MIDASENGSESDELRAMRCEQFIAMLGHDLRNPLHSILTGAEMLERQVLPPKSERLANLIGASAQRMAKLVEMMLDFTQGELTNRISIARRPVLDLALILATATDGLRRAHPDRSIRSNFEAVRSGTIYCDTDRVGQVLSYLVCNALRHGGQDTPVTIQAGIDGNAFKLSVSNRGNPIPADRIDSLCEPYSGLQAGHSREGLGLGLYLASKVAQGHGGSLEIESSPAAGTIVTLVFPASA